MAAAGVPILPASITMREGEGPTTAEASRRALGVAGPGQGVGRRRRPGHAGRAPPGRARRRGGPGRREAAAAFGDGTVFLERFVSGPRHIEVQVFGDSQGNVVHLFERECSIQRRHQKIVEESPSPAVDDVLREHLATAVSAAKAIGYVGAGTVEFVVGPEGNYFFLEVNTRLQVEHPVTEMVTGLDLVRVQVDVAGGQPLPGQVTDATVTGHAIEARLYAEDGRQVSCRRPACCAGSTSRPAKVSGWTPATAMARRCRVLRRHAGQGHRPRPQPHKAASRPPRPPWPGPGSTVSPPTVTCWCAPSVTPPSWPAIPTPAFLRAARRRGARHPPGR